MAEIRNKIRNTAPSLAELQKKRQDIVNSLTQQMAQPQAMQPQAAQPTANIGKKTAVGPKQALTPAADPAGMLLSSAGQQGSGTGATTAAGATMAGLAKMPGAKTQAPSAPAPDPLEAQDIAQRQQQIGSDMDGARDWLQALEGAKLDTMGGNSGTVTWNGSTYHVDDLAGAKQQAQSQLAGMKQTYTELAGSMPGVSGTDAQGLLEERERLLQQLKENKPGPMALGLFGSALQQAKNKGVYNRLHEIDTQLGFAPQAYSLEDRLGSIGDASFQRQGAAYTNAVGMLLSPKGTMSAIGGIGYNATDWDKVQTPEWMQKAQDTAYKAADLMEADSRASDAVARVGASGLGNFAIDLSEGAIDLASDAVANTLLPGSGLAMMGARSFGSGAMEARQKGLSEEKQMLSGAKSAAIEILTEKIGGPFEKIYGKTFMGKAISGFTDQISSRAGQKALKLFADALGEGAEEALSDIFNAVADRMLGLTDEGWEFVKDPKFWAQVLHDALVGGALGAGGGAVSLARGGGDPATARQQAEEMARQAMEQTIRQWKGEVATAQNEMTVRSGSAEDAQTAPATPAAGAKLASNEREHVINTLDYGVLDTIPGRRKVRKGGANRLGAMAYMEAKAAEMSGLASFEADGTVRPADGFDAQDYGFERGAEFRRRHPDLAAQIDRAMEERYRDDIRAAQAKDAQRQAEYDRRAEEARQAEEARRAAEEEAPAPAPSPTETLAQVAQGQTSPQEAAGATQSAGDTETAPTTQTSGTAQREVFNSGSQGTETAQSEDEDARYHRIVSEQAERLPDLIHDTTWKQAKGVVEKEARRIWKALHPYGPSFKSIQDADRSSVFSTYLMAMGVEIADEEVPMEAYSVGEDLAAHSGVEGYGLVSPFAAAAAVRDYLDGNTDKGANYIVQRAAWIDQQAKKRNGTELAYRDGEARAMARQAGNQPELVALARSIDKSGEAEWYAESIMRPLTELLRDGRVSDYGNEFLRLANGFSNSNDGSEDAFHVNQTLDLHSIEADENATKRFASFINAVAFGVEDAAVSDNAETEQAREEEPMSSSPAQTLADVASGRSIDGGTAERGPEAAPAGDAGTDRSGEDAAAAARGDRGAELSLFDQPETEQAPAEQAPAQPAQSETAPAQPAQQSETAPEAPQWMKRSKTESHTLQHIAGQNGGQQDALYYIPKTERETLNAAQARVDADRAGEMQKLMGKELWNAEDVDTALTIMGLLQLDGVKNGDFSAAQAWGKLTQERGTGVAQALQAFSKWTRSGAATAAESTEKLDAAKDLSPEQKKKIGDDMQRFAQEFDSIEDGDLDGIRELILRQNRYRKTGTFFPGAYRSLLYKVEDFDWLKTYAMRQMMNIPADYTEKASLAQKVKTIQINSMLIRFGSFVRNLGGNHFFGGMDIFAHDGLGLALDSLIAKKTGKRSVPFDRGWLASPEARKGSFEALRRATLEIAGDVDMGEGGDKYGKGAQRTFKMTGGMFSKFMSRWEQLIAYMMNAPDRFYRGGVEAEQRHGMERFENDERYTNTAQDTEDVARDTADYRLFQNKGVARGVSQGVHDLLNVAGFGGNVQRGRREGGFGLGDVVLPMPGVPANVGIKAAEFSPANVVKGGKEIIQILKDVKDGKEISAARQNQAVMNVARGFTGAPIIALLSLLVGKGIIKYAGDDDDEDVNALASAEGRSGAQINLDSALRLLQGEDPTQQPDDKLMSISWNEPLAAFITIAALAADEFEDMNGDATTGDRLKTWGKAYVEGTLRSLLDMPVMQSIRDITDAYKYSKAEDTVGKLADAGATLAGNAVTGLIPAPFSQTARAMDPYYRDTVGDTPLETAKYQVMNAIPGLRDKLPVKLDNFGNPKQNASSAYDRWMNSFIRPGAITDYRASQMYEALDKFYEETGDSGIYPDRKAPKSFTRGDDKIKMDKDERTLYQETYGKTAEELYTTILTDQRFRGLKADERAELLETAQSYARYQAKKAVLDGRGIEYEDSQWDKLEGLSSRDAIDYLQAKGAFDAAIKAEKYSAIDALLDTVYWKSPDVVDLLLQDVTGLEKRMAAREAGIPSMLWQEAKTKHDEIDKNEDLTEQQKAEQFAAYLHGQPWLSDDQRGVLREQFKFYQKIPANTKHYDALTAAGFDPDKAIGLRERVAALEPVEGAAGVKQWQTVEAIVTMKGLTDEEKWAALEEYLGKDTYEKAKAYREKGMDPDDWAAQYIAAKKK